MLQVGLKTENAREKRKKLHGNTKRFRQLGLAKQYVHRQHFKNQDEWRAFARTEKCPKDLPIHPNLVYKDRGWKGWNDFLGKKLYTYEEAKKVAQEKKVLNGQVWKETVHRLFPRPSRMPRRPDLVYKDEFEGWQVFLGHEKVKSRHPGPTDPHVFQKTGVYRPYLEALKFVSKLNLGTPDEWRKWRGTYDGTDLPWNPDQIYGEEWQGWSAWLGNKPLVGLLTDTAVMYLGRRATDPHNVYQVHVEAMGKSHLLYRAQKEGFQVLRVWKYDPTLKQELDQVLERNIRPYGYNGDCLVENVYGLMQDIMDLLLVV